MKLINLTAYKIFVKEDVENTYMSEEWYETMNIAPPMPEEEDFEEELSIVKLRVDKILFFLQGDEDEETSTVYVEGGLHINVKETVEQIEQLINRKNHGLQKLLDWIIKRSILSKIKNTFRRL